MKISARRFGILSSSSLVSATLGKIFIPGRGFLDKTVSAAAAVRSAVCLEHRQATRVRQPAGLAAALWGALWGGSALAGGYVAPILELAPAAPVATAGTAPSWWMALVPLFLIALAGRADRGDNGLTPLPGDYGGPCFGEDTLIQLERGWVPVQMIEAGERIVTSRGAQTILAVESWRPVDYRDRPFVVEGVRLSPNHGVAAGEIIVPACRLSTARSPIDGGSYFHILVADHSWLFAKAKAEAPVLRAESLCMTADLKLARKFPDLVDRHAADPVAPVRVGLKDSAMRTAA
ncbi:hypothetical protein [Paracoccus chinensis]|uniref:hypothetical protein n=1 Tax=Paracoccus chinensis TaxID=525640 RepID=UPI0011133EC2|nr:hypothetical protein [Paracoccus chinensis]